MIISLPSLFSDLLSLLPLHYVHSFFLCFLFLSAISPSCPGPGWQDLVLGQLANHNNVRSNHNEVMSNHNKTHAYAAAELTCTAMIKQHNLDPRWQDLKKTQKKRNTTQTNDNRRFQGSHRYYDYRDLGVGLVIIIKVRGFFL